MTVPDDFVGVWIRRSISVGGSRPDEWEDVVWIQTRSHVADLRVPRAGVDRVPADAPHSPWAFSGTTEWEPGRLRWVHTIDDHQGSGDEPHAGDEGDVRWLDDDPRSGVLLETGCFGSTPYEEVWERVDGSAGAEVLVLERPDGAGRLVQVGDHSLVLADLRPTGGVVARHDRRDGGRWGEVRSHGQADHLPTPDDHQRWIRATPGDLRAAAS